MHTTNCNRHFIALLLTPLLLSTALLAQAPITVAKKDNKPGILSIAYFVESANNSVNSLNSLLKKDNYRNKISGLNNPVNNELGFSLKTEILTALKPLLDKVKKTDGNKFREVIENFLNNPEENGIKSVKKYMPSLGIFSTVMSLVGNLVITEKSITREDLNKFIARIQQYFYQYEKLNAINEQFAIQAEKVLNKTEELKEDIKDFLAECVTTLQKDIHKPSMKNMAIENIIQKYYDPQKLQLWLDTARVTTETVLYPPDAPTTVKLITSSIKKLQKEFEMIYSQNYAELKELITSIRSNIPGIDQNQLSKTSADLEKLYNDSKQADMINFNITQVDERMNTACRIINNGK
ncbi:MAG TPA: hypothetical protein VFV31_00270 [Chitinophagaceae bacterium]|nr:hypothetical protein [Chitinophagaceae bacterium]